MNFIHFLEVLTVTFTITTCQKLPSNALASIMQEILSQGKPDPGMQLMKGAATKMGMPEFTVKRRSVIQETGMPRTVKRPAIVEAGVPRTIMRNEARPKTVIVQKTNEMVLPRNVVLNNANEFGKPRTVIVQKQREFVQPQNIVIQKSTPNRVLMKQSNGILNPMQLVMQNGNDMVTNTIIVKKPDLPNKVFVKNPEVTNRNILVQKANEIPLLKNLILVDNSQGFEKRVVVQKNTQPKVLTISEVNADPEVIIKEQKVVEYVNPEKVASVNPFLPAASPVSAFLAAAPAPNTAPQSRGQFLRKIPIPPPTI